LARPTIADLARAANVSISTVDRVLNGRDPVRRPTAERVLKAAEEIGFHATGAIRHRLRTEKPERALGFILQKRSTPFYRLLGDALAEATATSSAIRGHPVIDHLEEITPTAVSNRLLKLGRRVDAVALVAADHPHVTKAIDQLKAAQVPVFALISDLTASGRTGFIGLDSRKVGRTAAWAMAHFCKRPGDLGIFVGSHRFLCQELCEMSFRSYFRENAPEFHLLEPLTSLEDGHLAHESTLDLLRRKPDLVGLYVAGGGIEGVMEALREENAFGRIVTISHELTDLTRAGLIDGVVKLILSHPLKLIAAAAVDAMAQAIDGGRGPSPAEILLPFDVYTPENV
jgi:LacI family transcriptional regulator